MDTMTNPGHEEKTATSTTKNAPQGAQAPEIDMGPLAALMERAAAEAVSRGIPLPAYMAAAYQALLNASPALQEELESAHLLHQVDALRRVGKVGSA